jgi:hypothetical protein
MPILGPAPGSTGIGLTSIDFPIDIPAGLSPASIEISAINAAAIARSPFTGVTQTQEWPNETLSAKVKYPPLTADKARALAALLFALRGPVGTLLLGDTSQPLPRGIASGTPLLDFNHAAGHKSINVKGFDAGVALQLRSGDWISIGSGTRKFLYMNLTDVDSDNTGRATLNIFPRLRDFTADATPITVLGAKGIFRLKSNVRTFSVDAAMMYGFEFELEEAI